MVELPRAEHDVLQRVAHAEQRTMVAVLQRALAAYVAQHHPRLTD